MATDFDQCVTRLNPDEEFILQAAIKDAEETHGPIPNDSKPNHLGNYVFDFNNVPVGVVVHIRQFLTLDIAEGPADVGTCIALRNKIDALIHRY